MLINSTLNYTKIIKKCLRSVLITLSIAKKYSKL